MTGWTQEQVHEIAQEMRLTEDEQAEIAGYLHLDNTERARLTLLNILDDRLKELGRLYGKLGYSEVERKILRQMSYDPRFGIGARPPKADG